jgi:uncharacterized protein affecting Mg2+/Co2+ transport
MNFNKCIARSVLLLSFIGTSAFAQNGKAGGNTSQAVLTIQVNVVPMIALSRPQPMNKNRAAISYNIPVKSTQNTVTTISRIEVVTDESGKSQRRLVTTTTIVAE